MKGGKYQNSAVFHGYCRNCWKKFVIRVPIEKGDSLADIQKRVAETVRCCPTPDVRW